MHSSDSLPIQHNLDLKPYNSFGVSVIAKQFCSVTDADMLPAVFDHARSKNLPVLVLGGGSNMLLVDDFPGLVIHIRLGGVQCNKSSGLVKAGAGEGWHQLVLKCMNNGLHGLENLALIPGSAGAAPIQNIGAYGVELNQFVHSVGVYDNNRGAFDRLNGEECQFAYRDSLFKREDGAGLIITDITLQLHRDWQPNISYQTLKEQLGTDSPDHQQVFEAVCRIRTSKLPDPEKLGNAGSFFKNPVITLVKYQQLQQDLPQLPAFPATSENEVKIPAGHLLDELGWRGRKHGGAAVHNSHALVLVNAGNANGREIYELSSEMRRSVLDRFGIDLQTEVTILP
ncbi:MAG: UDP-N-acetylmuramate dehydrogenase [Gammaproteobacteria bacterium]|nr:UDP-N-acetylmuramate dehydrogenase [Gammaproteobacteria bacterium]